MHTVDSTQWTQVSVPVLPPSRNGSSMAYDAARQVTILFGGSDLNDTWAWNGQSWTQLHPAQSPQARSNASMVYDEQRQQILLFGGIASNGLLFADTWYWDGQNWNEQVVQTVPLPRGGAVLGYDSARQQAVLFGGEAQRGRVGELLNDMWFWNGKSWTEQSVSTAPVARVGASMAYDASQQVFVLFGGYAGATLLNDTWLWDGKVWSKRTPETSPPARSGATMVYDSTAQRIILVGGNGDSDVNAGALSDTWSWDGSTWTQIPTATAPSGSFHSAAYDLAHQNIVLYAPTMYKNQPGNKSSGGVAPHSMPGARLSVDLWLLK